MDSVVGRWFRAHDPRYQPRVMCAAKVRDRVFSKPLRMRIRKAFTPRGMIFFDIYYRLYRSSMDPHMDMEGLTQDFRQATRIVMKYLARESTRNMFTSQVGELRVLMRRVERGQANNAVYLRLGSIYAEVIRNVLEDRDIFTRTQRLHRPWLFFRNSSDNEAKVDKIRRDDPETYQAILDAKKVVKSRDEELRQDIMASGLTPGQKMVYGKLVITARSADGEELVYTREGEVYDMDTFREMRKEQLRADDRQSSVFNVDLDDLRSVPEEVLEQLDGEVEFTALTDDKAKVHGMTRVYSVQDFNGKKVIVSGRYKGIYLEDMINSEGRMIEGTAYRYDPKSNTSRKLENRNPDGSLNVDVDREPYVTVGDDGQLYMLIPGNRDHTHHRRQARQLEKLIPTMSVERQQGSHAIGVRFSPDDFGAVRDALQGMALSRTAKEKLEGYYHELARHEMATDKKNLAPYATEAIGGFKPEIKLYTKQKQALAWMESRGGNGVVALDTGVGKTAVAIAAFQRDIRTGFGQEEGEPPPKFLYVCPTTLRGNLPSEAHTFLENPKAFLDRVDIMSYQEFRDTPDSVLRSYAKIIFDEAQERGALKNPRSKTSAKALALDHPHKVIMTASPMENNPAEALVFASVCNNVDLNTTEGREMVRTFKRRFCETVGGRAVGLKDDPQTQKDFRRWVKQNLFYADKRDVEEVTLPDLRTNARAVTMAPEVEEEYRAITSEISSTLAQMVRLFRDRDTSVDPSVVNSFQIRLRAEMTRMNDLANVPDLVVPGAPNPKAEDLGRVLVEEVSRGNRTLAFTDSPKVADHYGQLLSNRFPGQLIAVGLSDRIILYRSGTAFKTFRPKEYTNAEGRVYSKKSWKVFVMKEVVTPGAVPLAILTQTYTSGLNLQAFSRTVHIDRDSFNNERLRQRRDRMWRNGQKKECRETYLDATFSDVKDEDTDLTLDQIMSYIQEFQSDLFDQVIIEAQSQSLGAGFLDMARTNASTMKMNKKYLQMALEARASLVGDAKPPSRARS